MELKYGFISADDHVQEHPEVWTRRMSKAKWGDRIPHVERQTDGSERWMVDGQKLDLPGVALAGAAMPDRALEPQRWEAFLAMSSASPAGKPLLLLARFQHH